MRRAFLPLVTLAFAIFRIRHPVSCLRCERLGLVLRNVRQPYGVAYRERRDQPAVPERTRR